MALMKITLVELFMLALKCTKITILMCQQDEL